MRIIPLILVLCLPSCVTYERSETHITNQTTERGTLPSTPSIRLALGAPTIGLFVGVSNYERAGQKAQLWETPAHTISAALMHEQFYPRATSSEADRRSSATVVADLRLEPENDLAKGTAHILSQLASVRRYFHDYEPIRASRVVGPGDKWPYFADGRYVTRSRILDAIDRTLDRAIEVSRTEPAVRLILYIAAHGWVGEDAEPYIIPADGAFDDPTTWISYRSVLGRIYDAMAMQSQTTSNKLQSVIILDTCQNQRTGGVLPRPKPLPTPPDNVVLIQSTSFGSYAYFWPSRTTITRNKNVSEVRWGFPMIFSSNEERKKTVDQLSARMSVIPVASRQALSVIVDSAHKSNENEIYLHDWVYFTKRAARDFLSQTPEYREAERAKRQEITTSINTEFIGPLFYLN